MISIIVAMAKNGVIGKAGDLPWRLSADLKHFAKITTGQTVVMGRKTYESIVKRLGHALPNRNNVILTLQADFKAPDCTVVHSVDELIKIFPTSGKEIFIIGGGEIYKQFLPVAGGLYVTEVATECDGDTFFPPYNKEDWKVVSSETHAKDERNSADFTFLELVRK